MSKLPQRSGQEGVAILLQFGFRIVCQRGSHIVVANGEKQRIGGLYAGICGIVRLTERLNLMRTTIMLSIQKKLVVDERGPQEVIIS